MNQYAIQTDRLSRSFGQIRAVDELSIQVDQGTVFGFLGPNGAGKTTTIRLLLGLLEPTGGKAEVLGLDTRAQSVQIRERSGALLENTGLYERLSAEDNLDFYGRVWHLSSADRQARIHELLSGVGLYDRRKETVANWSRGMKQKLAVARVLLHRPELVFLDEPTSGLDPVAAAALHEDLQSLAQKHGVSVFLTTHNLSEAEKLCQRVAVIRQGRLAVVGSPDELRMSQGGPRLEIVGRGFTDSILLALKQRPEVAEVNPNDRHIEIHLKGDVDTSPLVQLLVNNGVQIDEVRRGKASLEEVFLTLMEEDKNA